MSLHRWLIVVDVDDGFLAEHPHDAEPPPANPGDWDPSDLVAAHRLGIVDIAEADFLDYDRLPDAAPEDAPG